MNFIGLLLAVILVTMAATWTYLHGYNRIIKNYNFRDIDPKDLAGYEKGEIYEEIHFMEVLNKLHPPSRGQKLENGTVIS